MTVSVLAPDTTAEYYIENVPWQVAFNGDVLTASSELSDFIALDEQLGLNLTDWATSAALTFTVLAEGEFEIFLTDDNLTLGSQSAAPLLQTVSPVTFDVLGNPIVNAANTSVPAELCVGSSANVASGMVQGSSNGQPITFEWSNANAEPVLEEMTNNLINAWTPVGTTAAVSVNAACEGQVRPAELVGDLVFSITDGAGCQTETHHLTIVIHELPTFGNLDSPGPVAEVCSGEEVELNFEHRHRGG